MACKFLCDVALTSRMRLVYNTQHMEKVYLAFIRRCALAVVVSVALCGCTTVTDKVHDMFGKPEQVDSAVVATWWDGPRIRPGISLIVQISSVAAPPTTMNVLYKYSLLEQHSDIESENIKQAKHNIETTMDKVVEGFDTQLDKLFKSDAIDITNDVKVLEKMMKMEGLNK